MYSVTLVTDNPLIPLFNLQIHPKTIDSYTYIVKVKDIYGNNSKKNRSGPGQPKVIVNDFTNEAGKGDVEEFYGHLTSGRPEVCLDAFECESFLSGSDDEDRSCFKT